MWSHLTRKQCLPTSRMHQAATAFEATYVLYSRMVHAILAATAAATGMLHFSENQAVMAADLTNGVPSRAWRATREDSIYQHPRRDGLEMHETPSPTLPWLSRHSYIPTAANGSAVHVLQPASVYVACSAIGLGQCRHDRARHHAINEGGCHTATCAVDVCVG